MQLNLVTDLREKEEVDLNVYSERRSSRIEFVKSIYRHLESTLLFYS